MSSKQTIAIEKPPTAWGGEIALRFAMLAVLWGSLLLVYGPTLHAPMIFDDQPSISDNQSIAKLWPLVGHPGPLNPPPGQPISGRPLANLSLGINYHLSGEDTFGYHLFNLFVHMLNALMLWRIVTATLRLKYFQGRWDDVAERLGFVTAMLWSLHPLVSESVQYITQRTELMYSLFFLLTLYCALRYWLATSSTRNLWLILASLACILGMGCKEMMVSAPLIVLLFERTFISGSFAEALRKSWRLYVGLLVSWVAMFALSYSGPHSDNTGFHLGIAAHTWWFTQASVFLRYLKLAIWPWPLSIRYETTLLTFSQALPAVLAAGLLGIGTLVLLWKNNSLGFLGAWLWFIISPTLVVPMPTEVTAERRMYLPLAALATLVIVGGYALVRKITWIRRPITAAAAAVILCLSLVSAKRLSLYRDPVALWQQTVILQPTDFLSHCNLAQELFNKNRINESLAEYELTLRLDPPLAEGHNGYAIVLASLGRFAEAIAHFQEATRLDPSMMKYHYNLGMALVKIGRSREAIEQFEQAIALEPDYAQAHASFGNALQQAGDPAAAIREYREAIALKPDLYAAHSDLGAVLAKTDHTQEAIEQYQAALRIRPDYLQAHVNLTLAYAQLHQPQQAIASAQKALELAQSQGETKIAERIQAWLSRYRAQQAGGGE